MAKPSPETLRLRASRAYIFRVLYQGKPRNIEGVAGMENGEWVMPVYPASVNYRSQARSMVYATSGGAGGVAGAARHVQQQCECDGVPRGGGAAA